MTLYHCCMDLDKLLELTLSGEQVLALPETATYDLVRILKAEGKQYFSPCDNQDQEGRCAGHPVAVQR